MTARPMTGALLPAFAFILLSFCPAVRADSVDELSTRIGEGAGHERAQAAREPARIATPEALAVLLDIVQDDPDEDARASAAAALSERPGPNDPRVLDALLGALKGDASAKVRANAAASLEAFHDQKAATALIAALGDGDASVRSKAVSSLGVIVVETRDSSALRSLREALDDPDQDVRASAACAQSTVKDPDAVSSLVRLLKDDDATVRQYATASLGAIGDAGAVEALMPLLRDAVKSVRDEAGKALRKLGVAEDRLKISGAEASDIVKSMAGKAMGANDFSATCDAISEIGKIPDPCAVDALIAILGTHPQDSARGQAARVLASHEPKDERAVEALARTLKEEKTYSVRGDAATALGTFKGQKAYDALAYALNDREEAVRRAAAAALGELGDKRAADLLKPLLRDPSEYVIQDAAGALQKLGLSDAAIKGAGLTSEDLLKRSCAELAQGTWWNGELRKKIVAIAATVTPPPIPEEAQRAMAQGQAAVRIAKTPSDLEEAEKQFTRSATIAPWWADAYFNLGVVKEKMRDLDDAMECFSLYLAAAPNAQDAEAVRTRIYELEHLKKRQAEADVYAKRAYERIDAKDPQGAISAAQEAIRLDPESGWAHYRLAYALSEVNRNEESIKECEEAIRLDPKQLTFYALCGWLYGQLGNVAKERDILEEGLRRDPFGRNLANVHGNLGYAYRNLGDPEKALSHFESAIVHGHRDTENLRKTVSELKRSLGR